MDNKMDLSITEDIKKEVVLLVAVLRTLYLCKLREQKYPPEYRN